MKFYLLAGGLLLTGASVYGVTDYVNTKNNKAFQELYKEAPVVQATDVKISDIREEDFSRGKVQAFTPPQQETKTTIPEKPVKTKTAKKAKMKTSSYASTELVPVSTDTKSSISEPVLEPAKAPTEKRKLSKKITLKKFSRAPLKQEVILEEKKN
jgi:hypothetical protein